MVVNTFFYVTKHECSLSLFQALGSWGRARKNRGRTNVLSAMVLSLSVVPCGLSNKMGNSAREEFCSTEMYFYQSKQSHDSLQYTSQQEESSHN